MPSNYIINPDHFDNLWDLVPEDPDENDITDEMLTILHKMPIGLANKEDVYRRSKIRLCPDKDYLLISHRQLGGQVDLTQDKIRVISLNSTFILKHVIGRPSFAQQCTDFDKLEKNKGCGSVHTINDLDLLNAGILNLVLNCDSEEISPEDHDIYLKLLSSVQLNHGDMVYIPCYDTYSTDHGDIYRHILVYDKIENKLMRPKLIDNYGSAPPNQFPFPDFSIEHFGILGRSGDLHGSYRTVKKEIVKRYNEAEIWYSDEYHIVKKLTINGKDHYFFHYPDYGDYVPVKDQRISIEYWDDICDQPSGSNYCLKFVDTEPYSMSNDKVTFGDGRVIYKVHTRGGSVDEAILKKILEDMERDPIDKQPPVLIMN